MSSIVGPWRLFLAGVAVAFALTPPAAAREQLYTFRPADREALHAWAGLLRRHPDLARDARRHGFKPARDVAVLRVDLDGDGRNELVLYANLMPYCGSAGCMTRILGRRRAEWITACETYVEDGRGLVLDSSRTAGWRNFRGTYRVTWVADPARAAGVGCVEGETVDRVEQGRVRTGR
ncbi:hypothetical protein [Roseococcus sp. SYP-B2431]|uniref:hypothetical protein n=1 Tax=Roseococcus sp. SYP-B2431 TaxID=2496640 RepID=UPI00103C8DDD|nr:hypothetical protein [Roseococcus sp. SYP-B2431]